MAQYVLKKSEIDAMEGLSKSHFLNPDARRINKSLGDATGLTGIGVHLIEVPPDCESTEFHVHHFEDECTYVLSGVGEITVGTRTFEIGAGDFVGYRKAGEAHTMRNTGTEPLKCLVVGERLAHDVGDYPNKRKRIYRNAGMAWNLVDHDAIDEPVAGAK